MVKMFEKKLPLCQHHDCKISAPKGVVLDILTLVKFLRSVTAGIALASHLVIIMLSGAFCRSVLSFKYTA